MRKPLVSIALPVFNAASLLELSVRSLLNQTWQNWELFILDDGSTDGAVGRLSCLDDPRIIVFQDGVNKGLSARLNQAVLLARGNYFARMDHDDICHPMRLERQVNFLEFHPEVDLLATQCVTIDDHDRLLGGLPLVVKHSEICARPWQGFFMPHPTWLGRIEWFRLNPYLEPAPYCCEDQELLLRTYKTSCFSVLPESLLAYRVRKHTPLIKLMRTRFSLCAEQSRYFLHANQPLFLFMSFVATATRVSIDGLREFSYRMKLPSLNPLNYYLPSDEISSWNSLIHELKRS